MVTTTTPGGQRVSICTCTQTGRHLAMFTRRPGSSLYTLATEPPQVAASARVSASNLVAPPARVASCRTRLSFGTTALVTPPCHAFVACTPASLFVVFSGLCLPSRPRLPCPAFLVLRGGSAPLLTPPVRLQLREQFHHDFPILRLHSDRGGEFSSDLLRDFCCGEGILHSFTLPASPQQNGIAERHIGLVMEVARTSMIHAVAPHFHWPFAARYAAHQLNLWHRVSLPETSPTLRWTGKVGDASVFRGPAPSGVLQVDPLPLAEPVEVTVDSGAAGGGAARGAASGGAEPAGAEPGGAEPATTEPRGAEPATLEPGGAESEGAESGGAEPRGTASAGGPAGASPRKSRWRGPLSPRKLREWFARRTCLRSGTAGAGGPAAGGTGARGAGATSLGGAGVTAGAGGTGGAGAAGPGGACTRGTGPAGASGLGGDGAGDRGAGGTEAGGAGAGGTGAGDPGAGGAGTGGAEAGGAGAGDPGTGGTGARGAA
ncbi:unnamed protein product, partial [Closterium sp. NIES-54]